MARDRAYDITAAKQDLGYQPSVSFEQGLASMRAEGGNQMTYGSVKSAILTGSR